MGSGGGQTAMTVTWVILAVLAVAGFAAFWLLRGRGRRAGADKAGGAR